MKTIKPGYYRLSDKSLADRHELTDRINGVVLTHEKPEAYFGTITQRLRVAVQSSNVIFVGGKPTVEPKPKKGQAADAASANESDADSDDKEQSGDQDNELFPGDAGDENSIELVRLHDRVEKERGWFVLVNETDKTFIVKGTKAPRYLMKGRGWQRAQG